MTEYGIGRVPADVDPVAERLAEVDAVRLMQEELHGRYQPPVDRPEYAQIAQKFLADYGADALLAEARRIHSANPRQLGRLHFEWLLGHAAMHLATARVHAAFEAEHGRRANYHESNALGRDSAWWGEWDHPSPVMHLARLLNEHRIAAEGVEREFLTCRQCRQTGYSGGYPFSTLGGEDLCDDCV